MTTTTVSRVAITVDFNDVKDGNLLRTLERYVHSGREALRPGAEALLYDDEGNVALGAVERLQGELIFVRVDWATWNTFYAGILKTLIAPPTPLGYKFQSPILSKEILPKQPEAPEKPRENAEAPLWSTNYAPLIGSSTSSFDVMERVA